MEYLLDHANRGYLLVAKYQRSPYRLRTTTRKELDYSLFVPGAHSVPCIEAPVSSSFQGNKVEPNVTVTS